MFVSKAQRSAEAGESSTCQRGLPVLPAFIPNSGYNATEVLYRLWPIESNCFILFGRYPAKDTLGGILIE